MENSTLSPSVLRFGAVAAMLVAPLIVTFAILGDSNQILFFDPVFTGGSVEPWIRNVLAAPGLSKIIMVLPLIGFTCFLVTGWVLFQYNRENSWQKNLSLVGYTIGVPMGVVMWILQLSLMNYVLLYYGKTPEMDLQIQDQVSFGLYFFNIVNTVFGPLFIIVLGSGMMAWAALKAAVLPKWLCYWGMLCAVMLVISFLGFLSPALFALGLFAPLHMIWFSVTGVYLWRQTRSEVPTETPSLSFK